MALLHVVDDKILACIIDIYMPINRDKGFLTLCRPSKRACPVSQETCLLLLLLSVNVNGRVEYNQASVWSRQTRTFEGTWRALARATPNLASFANFRFFVDISQCISLFLRQYDELQSHNFELLLEDLPRRTFEESTCVTCRPYRDS